MQIICFDVVPQDLDNLWSRELLLSKKIGQFLRQLGGLVHRCVEQFAVDPSVESTDVALTKVPISQTLAEGMGQLARIGQELMRPEEEGRDPAWRVIPVAKEITVSKGIAARAPWELIQVG